MIFENEHWKLVITPRFIRKDNTKTTTPCIHCNGQGFEYDPYEIIKITCTFCHGIGKTETLPIIPPAPIINEKFLTDLKKWYQEYKPEE